MSGPAPRAFAKLAVLVGLVATIAPSAAAEGDRAPAPEGCSPVVRKIDFSATSPVWTEDLGRVIPLRAGGPFSGELLETSLERLRNRDVFRDVREELSWDGCDVSVIFHLIPRRVIAKIRFSGVEDLDELTLRRIARLREGVMVDQSHLNTAVERIRKAYLDEGYSHVQVEVVLDDTTPGEVTARVKVKEGAPTRIGSLSILGDLPADVQFLRNLVSRYYTGQIASTANLKGVVRDLVVGLRREGYLQAAARVSSSLYQAESNSIRLEVTVVAREPLSITFTGNTVFSAEELLAPLDLESRTVPFSPNALQSLLREIVGLYETEGYYFATATLGEMVRDGDREIYPVFIAEGPEVHLREIRFLGNHSVQDQTLLDLMENAPEGRWPRRLWSPSYLLRASLEEDLELIREFYQIAGFPNAAVKSQVDRFDDDGLMLTIFIEEGERAAIREIETTVRDALTDEGTELESLLPEALAVGAPLDGVVLEAERARLEDRLHRLGFPEGKVDLSADTESGVVRFEIVPGPRVTVGEIVLSGNLATRDEVLHRRVKLKPGDLWDTEVLRESEQGLYRTGIFSSVSLLPADGALDEPLEDLAVEVRERETGTVDLGLSYNTDEGVHVEGELSQRNLWGRGESVALDIDAFFGSSGAFFSAGQAKGVYIRPQALGERTDLVVDLFAQRDLALIDQFSYDRFGGSLLARQVFSDGLRGTVGLNAFVDKTFDVEESVIIGERDIGTTLYNFVRADIDWDHRNDVFNPTSGFRLQAEIRGTAEAIGSEVDLISGAVGSSLYTAVSRRLVWANRLRLATVRPFGSTETVPLSQRLFLGGRSSLRGFGVGEVGPVSLEGDIVGGDGSVNASTEFQYSLTDDLITVLFLDAGQAFLDEKGSFDGEEDDLSDLRYTPGAGARYRTPVGPLSVEYGIVLDRETGDRFGRLNIGIGGAF